MAVSSAATTARGMAAAARVGWAIESNWTHPLAYIVFILLRPVGGAILLVLIYKVAVGGPFDDAAVGFLLIGAALWSFVITMLQGISWTIILEREWLQVLKYLAAAPLPLPHYILARSAVRIFNGLVGAGVILAIGVIALGVELGPVDWPLLLLSLPLGIVALEAIGLALAGITMAVARFSAAGVSEGTAGVLYLLSGAVFPPSLLPDWLEPLSDVLPLTYWIEAARRSLLTDYDPSFLGIGDPLLPLVLTTLGSIVVGIAVFVVFDRRTRKLGRYDRTTEF